MQMLTSVRRWFQVLPDEGSNVLWFALLAGLLQAGVAIGMVAADSLFLAELGIEMLPLVFIFMPVVMAIYAPIYSVLISRLGTAALFRVTLALLVIGGLVIGFGAEQFAHTTWFLFAIRFYVGLWFIALYTLFWNFTDDYFNILDGKRLYGLIAAGSSAGAMLGGGLVTALSGLVPAAKLFLVWAANGDIRMLPTDERPASFAMGATFGLLHIVYAIAVFVSKKPEVVTAE